MTDAEKEACEPQSTTHIFALAPKSSDSTKNSEGGGDDCWSNDANLMLTIRELELKNADSPFTNEAYDDTTGLAIWVASLILSRWIAKLSINDKFKGLNVLELGAGCGVPGIACSVYGNPRLCSITDLNEETVDNLKYNIEQNKYKENTKVEGFVMDWSKKETWPTEKVDVLIGADLVYSKDIVPLITNVINEVVIDGGVFLYVAPDVGRDGLKEFIDEMKNEWDVVVEEKAGADVLLNPLASGDEEMCMLHFNEYFEKKFMLYEFRKRTSVVKGLEGMQLE